MPDAASASTYWKNGSLVGTSPNVAVAGAGLTERFHQTSTWAKNCVLALGATSISSVSVWPVPWLPAHTIPRGTGLMSVTQELWGVLSSEKSGVRLPVLSRSNRWTAITLGVPSLLLL